MEKESLSDKIIKEMSSEGFTHFRNFIWTKDIKESVRKLKEGFPISLVGEESSKFIRNRIDEIFGKDLV